MGSFCYRLLFVSHIYSLMTFLQYGQTPWQGVSAPKSHNGEHLAHWIMSTVQTPIVLSLLGIHVVGKVPCSLTAREPSRLSFFLHPSKV